MIEGRQGPDLEAWLAGQPEARRQAVTVTVTDLHEPFRTALATHLPDATAVADAFQVVGVGARVVDRTRRRVQQGTFGQGGHKGRSALPGPQLLTLAAGRLDGVGTL